MTDVFDRSIADIKNKLVCEEQHVLRKKYSRPQLESLGDLRSITLGGSSVTYTESGGGWVRLGFADDAPPFPE
ncbi:MAG TPA: hypothetical protein VHP14_23485 [Anaerolineales bacterium]|nr:hypothetical protein [Anaerolineales bacterium]